MMLIKQLREKDSKNIESYNSTKCEEKSDLEGLTSTEHGNDLLPNDIKKKMLGEIQEILDKPILPVVSSEIYQSELYGRLLDKIKIGVGITDKENLWNDMEVLIEKISPGFKYRLLILTDGKLTAAELKVALLIKLGFSPSQTAILINRSKNTVSSQRASLAKKIMGAKQSSKMIDPIIASL